MGKSAICDIGWLKTNTKTCTNTSVNTHTRAHVHTCSKGMSACALAAFAFGFHSIFITSSAYLRKLLHLLLLIIILLRTRFFRLCQLTKLVDELVPLRLPKVTGGAPEALQMPGGQVRKFVKFLHAKESQENRSLFPLSLFLFLLLFRDFAASAAVSLSAPAKQLSNWFWGIMGKRSSGRAPHATGERDSEGERRVRATETAIVTEQCS